MDPKTGVFHELEEYEAEHGEPPPTEWPLFSEGERLEVKGALFEVQRINRSSMVLRPVPMDGETRVAWELMRRYTQG